MEALNIYNKHKINRSKVLAFVMIMPTYLDVLFVMMKTIGFGFTSVVSAMLYVLVLVYIVFKCGVYKSDLLVLFGFYLFFAFNYVLFPVSREYIFSQNMIIIYAFFIPYGVFAFRRVTEWEVFFKYLYKFSIVAIISGGIMLLFLPYGQYLVYMDYSYSLLPAICSCFYQYKTYNSDSNQYNYGSFIMFAIGCIEIFAFGARSCIFFVALFVVVVQLLRSDYSVGKKIALGTVLGVNGILLWYYLEKIFIYLSSISMFSNSYLIMSFLRGHLFTSDSRDEIKVNCLLRIKNMGLEVSGLFGDRAYCGSVYPHNIVLEVLMQWGWILGILFLMFLLVLFIKGLLHKGIERIVSVFVVCTCFTRYFVSGSYVTEGKFWIVLFVLLSIVQIENTISIRRGW